MKMYEKVGEGIKGMKTYDKNRNNIQISQVKLGSNKSGYNEH